MPVTYTREQRLQSKTTGKGLVTLSYTRVKGGGITIQTIASPDEVKAVRAFIMRYLTDQKGGK